MAKADRRSIGRSEYTCVGESLIKSTRVLTVREIQLPLSIGSTIGPNRVHIEDQLGFWCRSRFRYEARSLISGTPTDSTVYVFVLSINSTASALFEGITTYC